MCVQQPNVIPFYKAGSVTPWSLFCDVSLPASHWTFANGRYITKDSPLGVQSLGLWSGFAIKSGSPPVISHDANWLRCSAFEAPYLLDGADHLLIPTSEIDSGRLSVRSLFSSEQFERLALLPFTAQAGAGLLFT